MGLSDRVPIISYFSNFYSKNPMDCGQKQDLSRESRYLYTKSSEKDKNSQDNLVEEDGRYMVDVTGLNVPETMNYCPQPSLKKHKHEFIKFTTSSMETDASQTALPFIDIQPVVTDPPVLLSGVGLFHKSIDLRRSGDFLAAKIFPFDYSPYRK